MNSDAGIEKQNHSLAVPDSKTTDSIGHAKFIPLNVIPNTLPHYPATSLLLISGSTAYRDLSTSSLRTLDCVSLGLYVWVVYVQSHRKHIDDHLARRVFILNFS